MQALRDGDEAGRLTRLERLGRLITLEMETRRFLGLSPERREAGKAAVPQDGPPERVGKYLRADGAVIFDLNGGVIKTGEMLVALPHKELQRTGVRVGDTVRVLYSPDMVDKWDRPIGKIEKKLS